MTTTTKKTLYALILPFVMTTFTTLSMEPNCPQLQLELQKSEEKLPTINAEIYIKKQTGKMFFDHVHESVYFTPKWERKKLKKAGIKASAYDPCILITVMVNHGTYLSNWSEQCINIINHDNTILSCEKFPRSIPAKYLWNLTTRSLLELTIYGCPVKMICKKNSMINNKEFHQQFEDLMKNFYKNPQSGIASGLKDELIPRKILIQTITAPCIVTHYPNGDTKTEFFHSYTHGENGCPNETALVKSIIDEKMPENKNIFTSLLYQQMNGSFPKK